MDPHKEKDNFSLAPVIPLNTPIPQPVLDLSQSSKHLFSSTVPRAQSNMDPSQVQAPLNLYTGLDLSCKDKKDDDNSSAPKVCVPGSVMDGTECGGNTQDDKNDPIDKPAFAYTMTPVTSANNPGTSEEVLSKGTLVQGVESLNKYPEHIKESFQNPQINISRSDGQNKLLDPQCPVSGTPSTDTETRNPDPGVQNRCPEKELARGSDTESREMEVDEKHPIESHEEDEDCEDEDDEDDEGLQKLSEFADMKKLDRHAITGRGVTLSMLMSDGLIQHGPGTMSIDYLGQKFTADLLEDGSIRWKEANKIFSSPSAWAIHCKKIVNPMKKSGCGWASVRYKGKKLDAYKSSWLRKKRPQAMASMASGGGTEEEDEGSEPKKIKQEELPGENIKEAIEPPLSLCVKEERKLSVKHSTLGRKSASHNPKTLVECTPFASLGKVQPFSLSISTSALLVMDFHSHLSSSEIVGYLGGKWDPGSQHLSIERAFACCCRPQDKENAPRIEREIRDQMEGSGLVLAGWYHSHPHTQADPTLHDLEAQLLYQVAMKSNDESLQPCVAFIISPYSQDSLQREESDIRAMWLMAPPEHRSLDYGMPMRMCYDVTEDQGLPDYLLSEMKKQATFHQSEPESVNFQDVWLNNNTYLDKLKGSLSRKLPKDQQFDRDLLSFLNTLIN